MASLLSIGSAGLSVGGARPAAAQTSRRCVPNVRMSADEFTVAVLGDLHLDPRKMEDYGTGRGHVLPILEDAKAKGQSPVLCSLGDLGESKSVRPEETQELQLSAFPDMDGLFEETLVCTVTDNPAPVEFKLSAIGSTPKLAIVDDASTVTFERLLLNRADNKRITLASRSALPLA